MVNTALTSVEYKHPDQQAEREYGLLVGIDEQKSELLKTLSLILNPQRVTAWQKKHYKNGLGILSHIENGSPLIMLSGEVGCGKTALAQTIGTPLALALGHPVKVFETPSNIRGGGMVGELSNRVTEAFESAKAKLKDGETGILIIDEADDLATSRSQNQAHHEDRAGLNVLIKQIDGIKKSKKNLAVIMITNRVNVLDPAVRRRTALQLNFERPTGKKLEAVLDMLFKGVIHTKQDLKKLLDFIGTKTVPYSFSDLIQL
ncbi:AAA family ATPase [Mucilaginibacter sp. 22184]|uniref:AAA family ATPase n=1 Tax=Mucilaginibacter sp. 22184 TaxID=3453887 RepID=UPI003F87636E